MPAIKVQHLSKKYRIYDRPRDKLRELVGLGSGKLHREFWALNDISFELESGHTLGIIGQNGSGKSTLLQILAGIMTQTSGDCYVTGKVSALLELGSGFNPEFTGRENVFMNGAILGLDSHEMEKRFDAIAAFAEIGSFMDQPVKTYSSGMFMRLAFAVAVNVDPDVLLVDEALSVGDLIFQHRCMHRMNYLRNSGKTIIFVTHDLDAITKFCDRALLLDGGRLLEDGKPDIVVQKYRALTFDRERRHGGFDGTGIPAAANPLELSKDIPVVRSIPNVDHRFGNGEAVLLGIDLLDEGGDAVSEIAGGQTVTIRISAQLKQDIELPIVGYTIRDRLGVEMSGCNTSYAGQPLPPARKGQIITSDFRIAFPRLAPGSYSISPAIAKGTILRHDMCDWIDNALVFVLRSSSLIYGVMRMEVDVHSYLLQIVNDELQMGLKHL
ncbi:MAG: ABC transporter ATP-binding protein [Acidobacteriota bacterium]|jgi:ABC-type polysaccharide/polyol phosphate transport system ATPase subunit